MINEIIRWACGGVVVGELPDASCIERNQRGYLQKFIQAIVVESPAASTHNRLLAPLNAKDLNFKG